jgi:integrase
MAKIIDKIREELVESIVSFDELEEIMSNFRYHLVEDDEDEEENTVDIIKFTNYSGQIWVKGETDKEGNVLVVEVVPVNRIENESTRVEPFRSYEDLEKVLNYFKKNGYLNHWITACMMASLCRRVGDTIALKWSDIFKKNGKYRVRLTQLKEEKTGKKLAPRLNALARLYIDEYIELTGVKPMQCYNERIVNTTSAAFRKMLKKAIEVCELDYPLSTHSLRKWWANTIYLLHPQDADNLMIIQTMLGHSDINTTKIYIHYIDRKQDKYNEDYAQYMINKMNGIDTDISNSPIVSIKAEDFRDILSKCWDMAQSGTGKFDGINELLGMTEQCMI